MQCSHKYLGVHVKGTVGMGGWMRDFNIAFAQVRPNRQAGTTVMRQMALAARLKLQTNMAAPGIEPGSRGQEPRVLTTRLWPPAGTVGFPQGIKKVHLVATFYLHQKLVHAGFPQVGGVFSGKQEAQQGSVGHCSKVNEIDHCSKVNYIGCCSKTTGIFVQDGISCKHGSARD